MEDKKERSSENTKTNPDNKYIHVSDIPVSKLDEDTDYQETENALQKSKSEKEKNQENETMGIP